MTTPPFPPAAREPQDESPTQPVEGAPIATPAPARSKPRSGGSGLLNIALGVALVVATAGIAFAVGRSTAPAAIATVGVGAPGQVVPMPGASFDPNALPGNLGGVPGNAGDASGPRGGFGLGGGITIEGTVDSVTADSVTVQTEGGQTITVGLDPDTAYHQQSDATATSVETGATVVVRLEGGFRPGANGSGSSGGATLGSASDVTVVP